jgi:hypothetical protein
MVILEQVGDRHIFVRDHLVRAYKVARGLVLDIVPLPLHRLVRPGQQLHRFTPTIAALLAPGHFALCRFQATLGTTVAARIVDHRAISQRGKGFQSHINAGFASCERQGFHRHIGA